MDFSLKAQTLAEKMNKLSETFNVSDEMVLSGDDIIEYVEEKTQDISLYKSEEISSTIVNLQTMVDDFKYIRETLRETTDNGRRVLNSVTLDLLDSDDDKRAALIMSFAELNKAVGDNMKLYMQSYKDISYTLLNIEKIKQSETQNAGNKTINNTLNVNTTEIISTTELLSKLRMGSNE